MGSEIQWDGHKVKLIAPQYVKPFVKTNKSDANDAEAIAEAAVRPSMNFVSGKSVEQQDIQSIHRIRERLITQRTSLGNQIRGLLAEYGIVIAKSVGKLKSSLPDIIENAENELSPLTRELLLQLYEELQRLNEQTCFYDKKIKSLSSNSSVCCELLKIDGVGPISATAIVSAIGNAKDFKNGRHFAAWLGLVPKQYSSGNVQRLGRISKRGNKYIRKLLIHGARAALNRCENKIDKKSISAHKKVHEIGFNKASVALANKDARIIWNLIAKEEPYIRN